MGGRRVDRRDAAFDLRHGRGGAHMVEQWVVKAVVRNRVTLGQLSPGEFGMGRRIPAEQAGSRRLSGGGSDQQ